MAEIELNALCKSPWFEDYDGPSKCVTEGCPERAHWRFVPPGGPNSYHCSTCSLMIYNNELSKPFTLKRRGGPCTLCGKNRDEPEPQTFIYPSAEKLDNRLADLTSVLSVGFVMIGKLMLAQMAASKGLDGSGYVDSAIEDIGILSGEGGT